MSATHWFLFHWRVDLLMATTPHDLSVPIHNVLNHGATQLPMEIDFLINWRTRKLIAWEKGLIIVIVNILTLFSLRKPDGIMGFYQHWFGSWSSVLMLTCYQGDSCDRINFLWKALHNSKTCICKLDFFCEWDFPEVSKLKQHWDAGLDHYWRHWKFSKW